MKDKTIVVVMKVSKDFTFILHLVEKPFTKKEVLNKKV